jgi:hypothetical protein
MFLLAARSPLHDRGNFLFRDNFSALCDKKLPKSLAANDGIRQIGKSSRRRLSPRFTANTDRISRVSRPAAGKMRMSRTSSV